MLKRTMLNPHLSWLTNFEYLNKRKNCWACGRAIRAASGLLAGKKSVTFTEQEKVKVFCIAVAFLEAMGRTPAPKATINNFFLGKEALSHPHCIAELVICA